MKNGLSLSEFFSEPEKPDEPQVVINQDDLIEMGSQGVSMKLVHNGNPNRTLAMSSRIHSKIAYQVTIREHSPKVKLIRHYTMVSRKRNSVIYRFASLLLVLMLSACSALQGTPQPAPPVTDHPQEIA